MRANGEQAAAFMDAFAVALHVSPHDLNSQYALAERVHSSGMRGNNAESAALNEWALECLLLFKVSFGAVLFAPSCLPLSTILFDLILVCLLTGSESVLRLLSVGTQDRPK